MPFIDLGTPASNNQQPTTTGVSPTTDPQPIEAVTKENVLPDLNSLGNNISAQNQINPPENKNMQGVKEYAGPPPLMQILEETEDGNDIQEESKKDVDTSANDDAGVTLAGSAIGKEDQVKKILEKADLLKLDPVLKTSVNNVGQSATPEIESKDHSGIAPVAASEKFIADKADLVDFLDIAETRNASDLHISTDYPPMIRVDGKLVSLGGQNLPHARVLQLFTQILTKDQLGKLETLREIDFSYGHKTGSRFRINIFHKKGNLGGVFRLIPSRIKSVAELGLPDVVYDFAKLPHGLILVTGPTGSGKSTTIASLIQEVNINESKHIVTMEDPIEYVYPQAKSIVDQREIGSDSLTFKTALRAVLRQDPNVVLVGEMRDYETIANTITVAETGHLVFSTLHTNSAAQSVDRMIDVFPEAQQSQIRAQLANVISAVISQRLIPLTDGGRKAAVEILIATPAVRNAIREAKTYQIDNIIQTNVEIGMVTFEKSLVQMIRKGEITTEDAKKYTTKPEELLNLLKSNNGLV